MSSRWLARSVRRSPYAHQRGVAHRDVKPSNILIEAKGRVVLGDFGLAIEPGATTLTETGMIRGTPAHMSPEQAMGRSVDGRSDVYALALVVSESLSAGPWIQASASVAEVLEQAVQRPAPASAAEPAGVGSGRSRGLSSSYSSRSCSF